ncbi:hypothetical protein SLA_0256 [Streptomyces laurentii]|uniref:Secreted protein n=1 Tax=Streptomyces laurentii TaxID=39478 RepID=A0A160NUI8_STRLU|nr:hypothetical protein SLA_0256 [Streptomyces laurentii]
MRALLTHTRTRVPRRAAVLVASVVLAGTAAAVGQASADTSAAPRAGDFAAQARAAGLSAAQARVLQDSVDAQLALEGGTQTAANEITLPGGVDLLVPLPGESKARDLDAPATRNTGTLAPPADCGSYTFCAYSGEGFTGVVKRQMRCSDTPLSIGWSGNGSWSNNQSSGTRARMYGSGGNLIYTTPGAYSEDRSGSWTPVFKVDAC